MSPMFLPATPSLRRLLCAYLTGDALPSHAEWWAPWRGWTMPKCYNCDALNQHRPPVCLACGDTRTPWMVHALPLHVPAGLAVARLRLRELCPWSGTDEPERVAAALRTVDPEMRVAEGEPAHAHP